MLGVLMAIGGWARFTDLSIPLTAHLSSYNVPSGFIHARRGRGANWVWRVPYVYGEMWLRLPLTRGGGDWSPHLLLLAGTCVENTDEKPGTFVSAYWDPFSVTRSSGLKRRTTRDLPVR
jgi:hypothetical protein